MENKDHDDDDDCRAHAHAPKNNTPVTLALPDTPNLSPSRTEISTQNKQLFRDTHTAITPQISTLYNTPLAPTSHSKTVAVDVDALSATHKTVNGRRHIVPYSYTEPILWSVKCFYTSIPHVLSCGPYTYQSW